MDQSPVQIRFNSTTEMAFNVNYSSAETEIIGLADLPFLRIMAFYVIQFFPPKTGY